MAELAETTVVAPAPLPHVIRVTRLRGASQEWIKRMRAHRLDASKPKAGPCVSIHRWHYSDGTHRDVQAGADLPAAPIKNRNKYVRL